MAVRIRDLKPEDRPSWEPLWAGYLEFYESELDAAVTDVTWLRFLDPNEPMFALVAEDERGLVGFVHCVVHRGTWSVAPLCYLEDLFVSSAVRNQGVGRKLIEAVYARADQLQCDRVYWLTHETNTDAQALYNKIATRSGFIHYRR